MDLPTNSQPPSSTSFANDPLVVLIKRPVHLMSQDELRAYTTELRTLQKSPQALGRKLKGEAEEKVVSPGTSSKANLDALMREMEG